jgi:hypothetical protein
MLFVSNDRSAMTRIIYNAFYAYLCVLLLPYLANYGWQLLIS